MAEYVRRRWQGNEVAGLPRRDRRSCDYRVYLPDKLAGRHIGLDGEVAADVSDAEAAIARLNASSAVLADTEALARLLLRAESVASSRIEGLEIGARRLLRAEADFEARVNDVSARDVLGNIAAMSWAVQAVPAAASITPQFILEIHRRLLAGTALQGRAGSIRDEQNWIGGSSYNPCSADYVPPPPELVWGLLEDLCAFCNTDSLPPLVQAALAHAQFETIHPFIDGNGRTGRVLIHLILKRRGLAPRVVPPLSLALATWARDYVQGLTDTRYEGAPDSPVAYEGLNQWVGLFAAACSRAVSDAGSFEERARELQDEWWRRLGRVRARSAVELLVRALPGTPVLSVEAAAVLIGRSFQQTNEAISRLVDAGILRPVGRTRRNRTFEARELVDAFTDLERQLASPEGNTRISRPSRRVPTRMPRENA